MLNNREIADFIEQAKGIID